MASNPSLGGAVCGAGPAGGLGVYNLKLLSEPTLMVLSNLNRYCSEQLNGTSLFRLLSHEAMDALTDSNALSATDLANTLLDRVADAAEHRCSDLSAIASLYGELESPQVLPEARQFLETAHRFYNEYCEARSTACLSEVTAVLQNLASDSDTPQVQERQPSALIVHLWKRLPHAQKEALRTSLRNDSLADTKPALVSTEGFLTPLGALIRETEEYVCSPRYTRALPEEIAARLESAREAAAASKKYFAEHTGLNPDVANRLRYQLRHMVAHWNDSPQQQNLPHLKKLPAQDAQSVIAQMAHSEFIELKSTLPKILSKLGVALPQMKAPLLSEPVAAHTPKIFKLAQDEIMASLDDFVENLSKQLMNQYFPSYTNSANPKREAVERQLKIPTKKSNIMWPGGENWGNDIY